MRLTQLEPQFIARDSDSRFRCVPAIAEADGIRFKCPLCFQRKGNLIGVHSIICWRPHVPQSTPPVPGRWQFEGTGYGDLTLVAGSSSILLTVGCRWHGFIRRGAIEGGLDDFPIVTEEPTMTDTTLLDGNVKAVLPRIKGLSKADLEGLLEAELAGSSRKTVIDGIKAGMAAIDAAAAAELAEPSAPANAAGNDPGTPDAPEKPVIEKAPPAAEDGAALLEFSRAAPRRADLVALVRSGAAVIVFGDGEREIDTLARISAGPEDFAIAGDKAMYRRPINFAGHAKRSTINAVALVDGDGNVASVIDVSRPGLDVGGGINAEYPAGSLIF